MAARDGPIEAVLGPVSHSWLNPSIGCVQHSAQSAALTVFSLRIAFAAEGEHYHQHGGKKWIHLPAADETHPLNEREREREGDHRSR